MIHTDFVDLPKDHYVVRCRIGNNQVWDDPIHLVDVFIKDKNVLMIIKNNFSLSGCLKITEKELVCIFVSIDDDYDRRDFIFS